MAERGITASAGRLIVTTGSQQGLDLIARVLLDPGDVVLVELPSYTGAISAFRNVGASLVGVRQEPDGIDLDELDATLVRLRAEGRRVKALYVVPNFQNPTGLLIGLGQASARPRMGRAARRARSIEDDPYRDLYFPDVATEADTRPIAADDANGRVIYLSSFSKTLAPGFRVAWLHAPEPIAAKLELAKQAADSVLGRPRSARRLRGVPARHPLEEPAEAAQPLRSGSATRWSRRCIDTSTASSRGPSREAASSCGRSSPAHCKPTRCSNARASAA